MALAGAVSAAIADLSAPPWSLKLDGVDLLAPPVSGRHFFADIETIDLVEEGPGGVSSLSFTIRDPLAEMVLAERAVATFWDHVNNRPLFQGWMEKVEPIPWAAAGRDINVTCVGVEALLDWMLVPAITVPVNTTLMDGIQMVVANATGVGWPIRAFAGPNDFIHSFFSTQALPMGWIQARLAQDVVVDGASLREAINQVIAAAPLDGVFKAPGEYNGASFTIDFTSGLRVMATYLLNNVPQVSSPSDYGELTMQDTVAGTNAATTAPRFTLDSASVARQVYVTGTGVSGLYSDGSGIPGPVAQLNDPTITTTLAADLAAGAYLFGFAPSVRGSFDMDPTRSTFVASGNYRAGGKVTFLTDTQVVSASMSFIIAAIHKRWAPGAESWSVDFGGFRPSAMKQVRRLTRAVRS